MPNTGVLAAALVLLAVGPVVFLTGRHPAASGWYAYSPLTGSASSRALGTTVMWSERELLGAGVFVLGLVVGAATLGYLVGRRRHTSG